MKAENPSARSKGKGRTQREQKIQSPAIRAAFPDEHGMTDIFQTPHELTHA